MKLVVLANAFPYGYWEPYLETEINFYEGYETIDLFSLSVRDDQWSVRRELPSHIQVHAIPFQSGRKYLKSLLNALPSKTITSEALKTARNGKNKFAAIKLLATFISRAHFEASVIDKKLAENGFKSSDEFVLYSYRMEYHAYLCLLLKRRYPHARIVLRGHGYDLYEERSKSGYFPFREEAFSAADRIVTISEHGSDYLAAKYPAFKDKLRLRKLGTLDRGLAVYSRTPEIRILSVSAVVPIKRVHLIADALASFPDYQVTWTHFGMGTQFEELSNTTKSLPSNVRVELKGETANDQLLEYMKSHEFDFLINVSAAEGIPVSFMEAMSLGIPVLASNVGGSPEIVVDGFNGYLMDAECKPANVREAIKRFHEREDEAVLAMRNNARQFWEENHNASVLYTQFNQELTGLVDDREES